MFCPSTVLGFRASLALYQLKARPNATFLESRVTAGGTEAGCLATFSLPNHATSLSPCGLSGNGQTLMTPHML